jgi:hypothetical protein
MAIVTEAVLTGGLAATSRVGGAPPEVTAARESASAADSASGSGLGNPFKGKMASEVDGMMRSKGFDPTGPDPAAGKGGYVNPKSERSYHIDEANRFGEKPHVDVNRSKSYKGNLDKKKYPM